VATENAGKGKGGGEKCENGKCGTKLRGGGGKHEKGKKVQHKIADVENAGKVMHV